jgi:UDP-N-acetylmuramoylalanine-D-glutamate ligase
MKFHIIGVNKVGINVFNYLKKKKFKVTISDINTNIKIKKKNFYYGEHPKHLIKKADKLVFCPGVIKKDTEYKNYILKKKAISELDLFNKFNKWPSKNILFVSGSRGKTSVCKKVYKKLINQNLYKKIFYLDREKYTFSNLPKYKEGFFLIAEVDYQTLLITKSIDAKYRILTSFFKIENKALKNDNLYLKAKLKIFSKLKKNDYIFVNNQTLKKIKRNIEVFKNKVILTNNSKSIKKINDSLVDMTIKIIKKKHNEKY